MTHLLSWALAAIGLAVMTGCSTDKPISSIEDSTFLQYAAGSSARELQMGRIGLERSQSPQVRQLAQRILDDQARATEDLESIAQDTGVIIASVPPEPEELKRLQKLSGPEFDKTYMEHMLRDHERDIRRYELAIRQASNPSVRDFASRTLPMLQDHLRMAQQTEAALRSGGGYIVEPAGTRAP